MILLALVAASLAILLSNRRIISNVSAVEVSGSIGIFWDANCTKPVSLIDWGNLTLGTAKKVTVYVRNEESQQIGLRLTTKNWSPIIASSHMAFSWRSQNSTIGGYKVVNVTLSLYVFLSASRITSFSFDILFEPLDRLLGDVNGDGVVDMRDVQLVFLAYSATPGDPKWNATADLHPDGIINMVDMWVVMIHLGERW
jgi:hypothetical protein